jgi:hypothetical protein
MPRRYYYQQTFFVNAGFTTAATATATLLSTTGNKNPFSS